MTRHSEPRDDDDQALSEEFRGLREMEPPPGLREKCLAAANEAAPATPHRSVNLIATAWPRAGILVSAIAASLLVGIGIGWSLRGETNASGTNEQVAQDSDSAPLGEVASAMATSAVNYDETLDKTTFRQEETYLCGVGRIKSKSIIQLSGE
ncbi:hypothetical protein [Allorhodopirellula solitaria]|uniref:Uncharacterized protein n=1 Tax=Allorhodopirellula solitaria TaxID=2527987 RepID=A0A5C5XTT0_9BACT|nr:hypothetical protein [Allorhodopirellula solitaria]TWT66696.1 hypothetical protein CA85_27930 [Allorhodopirellula solitaria]